MRQYLGDPAGPIANDEAAKRLAMQKMAIEGRLAFQRATPVNATALVSAVLLATRPRADPASVAPHHAGFAGPPAAQEPS